MCVGSIIISKCYSPNLNSSKPKTAVAAGLFLSLLVTQVDPEAEVSNPWRHAVVFR